MKGANFQDLYKECVIPSPCWMVYRTDLEKCAAFRPNRYPEDYDLCFRFYENGLKIIPNDQVLHQWRDYPNRTSRTDKNYADNRFLAIKVHYFLKLEMDKTRPLVIWGAGRKGKLIARQLIEYKIDFQWVCNNERKIGRDIYGQILLPFNAIKKNESASINYFCSGELTTKGDFILFTKRTVSRRGRLFLFLLILVMDKNKLYKLHLIFHGFNDATDIR